MMMNDTVARIVEIMFQDVEMNEEVSAIRDEVMNNCQERYIDLVNSGMSDDDAIAAVIESLKGMDEVLAPYKRRDQAVNNHDGAHSQQNAVFAADQVNAIDLHLVNEDVHVERSEDEAYHVVWDADENPLIDTELKNGTLTIKRLPEDERTPRRGDVDAGFDENMSEFVRTGKGRIEINIDGIESAMKSLGNSIRNIFSKGNMNIHFGFEGTSVTVQVPQNAAPHLRMLTTSGDMDVRQVGLAGLSLVSTSGDIDVDLNEDQHMERIELRTISGDMNVNVFADCMNVSSTSGDVEVEGRVNDLSVSTISGDVDVRADVVNMTFKAVSGDVDMTFDSEEIRQVRGSTISGDIGIELPDGIGNIAISTQTRSGDVKTRRQCIGLGPTVSGGVSSVSGDITIR